jgi:hypothetical protein
MLRPRQFKVAAALVALTGFAPSAGQAQVGPVLAVAGSVLQIYGSLNASGAPNLDLIILESILQLAEQNVRIAGAVAELDRKVSELPVEIGRSEFERRMNEQLELLDRLHRESLNAARLGIAVDFSAHMKRLYDVHSTLTEMMGGYGSLLRDDTGDGASQISLINSLIVLFTTVAKTGEMLLYSERYRATLVANGAPIREGEPNFPRLSMLSFLTLLESIRDKIGQLSDIGKGRVYRLAMNRQVGAYRRETTGQIQGEAPAAPRLLVDSAEFDALKDAPQAEGTTPYKFNLALLFVVRTWRGVVTHLVPTDTRITGLSFGFGLRRAGDIEFYSNELQSPWIADVVPGHLLPPQVEARVKGKGFIPGLQRNEVWELKAARTRWAEDVQPKIIECFAKLEPTCIDTISLKPGHPDFQNIENIKQQYKSTVFRIRKISSDVIAGYNYSLQLHTLIRMKTKLDGILDAAGFKK